MTTWHRGSAPLFGRPVSLETCFSFHLLFFFLFPLWRALIHTWNNTGTNIWTVNTAVRATECWQASRVGCAKHSSDPQRVNILKAVNSSLEASQMWFRMRGEQNKCGIEPKPNREHSRRCITRQVIKSYCNTLMVRVQAVLISHPQHKTCQSWEQ